MTINAVERDLVGAMLKLMLNPYNSNKAETLYRELSASGLLLQDTQAWKLVIPSELSHGSHAEELYREPHRLDGVLRWS